MGLAQHFARARDLITVATPHRGRFIRCELGALLFVRRLDFTLSRTGFSLTELGGTDSGKSAIRCRPSWVRQCSRKSWSHAKGNRYEHTNQDGAYESVLRADVDP